MGKKVIETERLILQEFVTDDAPFLLELLNTPAWLKFIGDRGVHNLDQARDYAKNRLMHSYSRVGYGLFVTRLKETNAPIGMCGVLKRDTLEDPDLGFAFLPAYMKNGYAYEAASATVQFANRKLRMKKIVAITQADNDNSIRLLTKLGFGFEKTVVLAGDTQTLMLYRWTSVKN
jgi:RimJ/RimL family protein N-acetyltransferase